jgi:hypothetical protein
VKQGFTEQVKTIFFFKKTILDGANLKKIKNRRRRKK